MGHEPFRLARVSAMQPQGCAFALTWPRDFDFLPGQLVEIALEETGPSRLYSLFTGPRDAEAGVLFNPVEGGELSPSLARLSSGDKLWIKGPSGSFPALDGPAVWIANGTGVAPFVSMSRAGLSKGKTLLHGARDLEDFYFSDELERAMSSKYVRCSSRLDAARTDLARTDATRANTAPAARGCGGLYAGRLTSYLAAQSWDPELPFELCGSASMIVDVRELLIGKGIPHSKIVSEVYY